MITCFLAQPPPTTKDSRYFVQVLRKRKGILQYVSGVTAKCGPFFILKSGPFTSKMWTFTSSGRFI